MAWNAFVDLLADFLLLGIPDMIATKQQLKKGIRVRMAPSPTGHLHIGTARTALFNLLFARRNGGTVILRFEDTDAARSTKESEKDILENFTWLGIKFDEGVQPDGSEAGNYGPYRQSECFEIYEKELRRLLSENKAYYCFCSKEELEAQKVSQETDGIAPRYSGKCRSILHSEAEARVSKGESAVVRLKVAPERIKFTDLIRGEVEFDNTLMGDIVIARNIRSPLYHFAVVVDDFVMQITHVIRGEDHLANTAKHLAIFAALGIKDVPAYAHIPLILSATGKGKMSKRDGGTSIKDYRDAGYLPDAMINFLALLGWHPEEGSEILSFDQIVKEFTLERVQKGGASFDKNKLDFFNAQYLKRLSVNQLISLLSDEKFSDPTWRQHADLFEKVVTVVRDRLVTLADFRGLADLFFTIPAYDAALLPWKKSTPQAAKQNLEKCRELLQSAHDAAFHKQTLEPLIMPLAEQLGKGDVLWPLRVALSGKDSSPPPLELAEVLGKTESLSRIDAAILKLGNL